MGDDAYAARRRVQLQIVVGLLGLAACILAAWKVPPWLVGRAEKQADRCLIDDKRDPAECRPGAGLAIAAVFPHTKARAVALSREADRRIARRAIRRALAGNPDPQARTSAAQAFVASRTHDASEVVSELGGTGAYDVLATIALGGTTASPTTGP